jgi:CTP:molybdopterin cytidylyltransferase MocA
MIEQIDAVVLAGGGEIEPGTGVKGMLTIGSRLMVDYVMEALNNSINIEQIVVVGPEVLQDIYMGQGYLFALPGETILESFTNGVDVLNGSSSWIMACTGDIPFLTAEAVDDFIEKCREGDADFYYPVVRKETAEKRFPGAKRTYATLKDGTFTGGNIFLLKRDIIDRCLSVAAEFVKQRKNPTALARLVGFGMLVKFFIGQLSIAEAERRVSQLVGARGSAVITHYAEIGVDVDKPSDWELAQQLVCE